MYLIIPVVRTTKRPVPLEHCLFYSGEFYKVCESEKFIPLGLKAAKDACKKKSTSTVSGGTGRLPSGSSASHDASQKRATAIKNKQNKHSGPQNLASSSGAAWGYQNNGSSQNNWGSRRSEASLWLLLINKLAKLSLLPVRQDTYSSVH